MLCLFIWVWSFFQPDQSHFPYTESTPNFAFGTVAYDSWAVGKEVGPWGKVGKVLLSFQVEITL